MSMSQAPTGSNEDERRKEAMGKAIEVEDIGNKSTYNSLSSGESSGSEIDATASKEMRRLAKRMAKRMAKKKGPYYECGEFGHFIAECPKKKNKGKKEWRKDKYKKEDKNKGYKN